MYKRPREDLRGLFEKKAKEGDGAYAIAFALMDLADAQEDTAAAILELTEIAHVLKSKDSN